MLAVTESELILRINSVFSYLDESNVLFFLLFFLESGTLCIILETDHLEKRANPVEKYFLIFHSNSQFPL